MDAGVEVDFMKIMVCYENSRSSGAALRFAMQYAASFQSELLVVHSLVGKSETTGGAIKKAENRLLGVKTDLLKQNIICETHLLIRGLLPGEDLVQFASEKKVDQVFIGIEKKSKVGKFIFGSTAQHVILEAPCPVTTVKSTA